MIITAMNRILCIGIGFLIMGLGFAQDFDGAKWIGVPTDQLAIYADYLPVFKIDYDVEIMPGSSATMVYGQNDPRLMNPNLNIYNLASVPGESAIKVKADVDGTISIYRSGYHADDNPEIPIAVFDGSQEWSDGINHIQIASNLGNTTIYLNGKRIGSKEVNPIGSGADYISFPVLAGMGAEISGDACIKNLKISNFREPGNILFSILDKIAETRIIEVPKRGMPALRTDLEIGHDKEIATAKIDVTARGIYDMSINGKRITDGYFYPGSTQYNKTHLYNSFDITSLLVNGNNIIDVQLGEGWWSGPSTFKGENWNFFGDRPSLLAVIRVKYSDGTEDKFVSSPDTWSYTLDTPLIVGSFFQGEIYDATVTGSVAEYHPAVEITTEESAYPFDCGWSRVNLRKDYGDNVIAVDTLSAVTMTEPRDGVYVYDFGQNFAGVPFLTFHDLEKGKEVGVRYAEVLYPDMERYSSNKGMIMTENIRAAMNRDAYIAAGSGTETFSPRFTLHGFRYLEVSGLDEPLALRDVKALPLSSVHHFNADFECSDSLVNRLWKNILWSTRSNFISIPTDCPQRNERLGWMGDISVYSSTAQNWQTSPLFLGNIFSRCATVRQRKAVSRTWPRQELVLAVSCGAAPGLRSLMRCSNNMATPPP